MSRIADVQFIYAGKITHAISNWRKLMRLRISVWLFLLGLLITSCGGGNNLKTEATDTADGGVQISTVNTPTSASLELDVNQLTTNCTVVSRKPTPGPTQESLFPPVNEHDWIKGSMDAEITLIEYSDFQ